MNDRRDKDLLPTERRTLWALRTTVSARILCFLSRVAELPRRQRQSLAVAFDAAACVVATWLAFALRVGAQSFYFREYLILLGVSLVCWFTIALWRGIYRSIIRFSGGRTMAAIALSGTIMMVPMSAVFLFYGIPGIPRTLGILQPVLLVMLLGGLRLAIRFALSDVLHVARGPGDIRHVMIYGAGRAGQQLALSLRHEAHVRVVGYLDDDRRLDGQRLDGVPVYCADRLEHAKTVHNIDEVLIALPKATRAQRRQIVERLQTSALSVRSLPPTAQILSGQVSLSDLRDVAVEDLLGRDPVAANPQLMDFTIVGKTVLVSGAGGSIGSELCRQIISVGPERLIIADQSEFALYAILEELKALVKKAGCTITIVPELANVADRDAVLRIYRHWRPNTVFHAAAYKHVPLVEANPIAGMTNNILGTLHSCLAAEAVGVTTFTLISSDKAVRPTNIMGASKRVCELVLQARAREQIGTIFTMVRFGNVLGSSGSVVPLFKEQIAAGGPVTITARDVTRYFMTIPEASQLVIQASAMAKGGDVFVLDMGQPVNIAELAETMIQLSGLSVRDAAHPDGDIEIVEIGLRPGEKRYEELLIGDVSKPTLHERIIRAHERMIPWPQLETMINQLRMHLAAGETELATAQLRVLVPDYLQNEAELPVAAA